MFNPFRLLFVLLFLIPQTGLALERFIPLQTIPGVNDPANFTETINALFRLGFGFAALLAVLMIAIGGFQYMLSDAVGSKEDAKDRIWSAILGLILILASVLLLGIINPQLLQVKFDPTVNVPYQMPGITYPNPCDSVGGCQAGTTGRGGERYEWTHLPTERDSNGITFRPQSCRQVRGEGWVGVDARFCTANDSSKGTNESECCRFNTPSN